MAVSDKVNIQLEVTGGAVSAQEIDRVNKGLQQMGVDATTASEVGKKLSQNNKDVKEGLQALALAAAQVSPAAAEAVRGFSALKLAQEGLIGVSKNLKSAFSAVFGLIATIPGGAIAGLLAVLGVVTAISAKVKEWEENQRRASDAARATADALSQTRDARQGSAQTEAREIGRIIGGLGGTATAQSVEDTQRRARLLQEAVPTASSADALRVAATSIATGTDFNTASAALAARSFGSDVTIPAGLMSGKDAARYGLELSAGRLTPAQRATLGVIRDVAPIPGDSSTVGAFSESNVNEQSRRRAEARMVFTELQASQVEEARINDNQWSRWARSLGLPVKGVAPKPGTQLYDLENNAIRASTYNNCIINNRPGEPTGVLGPPSDATIPIP